MGDGVPGWFWTATTFANSSAGEFSSQALTTLKPSLESVDGELDSGGPTMRLYGDLINGFH